LCSQNDSDGDGYSDTLSGEEKIVVLGMEFFICLDLFGLEALIQPLYDVFSKRKS
jgi:hypothetical protein